MSHTNDTNSFCAYDRSKLNIRDRVEQLEGNAGNIISHGFLMAEYLNEYISSVFGEKDINSVPVPDTKFQEVKSDYSKQLIVSSKMVAQKGQ